MRDSNASARCGVKNCGNCSTCDYVQEGQMVKSTMTNIVMTINTADIAVIFKRILNQY